MTSRCRIDNDCVRSRSSGDIARVRADQSLTPAATIWMSIETAGLRRLASITTKRDDGATRCMGHADISEGESIG